MVESLNHPTARTPASTVRSYVARSFVARVRSWIPLLSRVLFGLLVWTGVWYAVYETTATTQVAAMAAIGFWFGWLFVFAVFVFLVFVLVTGVIKDARDPILA